ncbi:MAG: zinc ribbon domain-containing protein [Clostridiales bacterium]|jgi:predicted nucleic acid-binding Zn ribbon protein|nr:zinc ribbon domain-containing protein [Clostridiales bacterium]
MSLLDGIGKKIAETTQNVVRSTKELTDTARLNSLISDEQRQITNLRAQIGKLIYEAGEHDPETQIGKLCIAITAANERIARHTEEIRQVKGTKRCQVCGADVPLASAFCGKCGAAAEVAENPAEAPAAAKSFCSACGAELPEGSVFCTACGQKQEQGSAEQ